MTRAEHLAWAKERALEYLPGNTLGAATSFLSDLRKHEELKDHPVRELILMHELGSLLTTENCRDLITGTN